MWTLEYKKDDSIVTLEKVIETRGYGLTYMRIYQNNGDVITIHSNQFIRATMENKKGSDTKNKNN